MPLVLLGLLSTLLVGAEIDKDERVLFFPALGRPLEGGAVWTITVHGWIFEPEASSSLRAMTVEMCRNILGVETPAEGREVFTKRILPFLYDNERAHAVSIRIGERTYDLEKSEPSGHFTGTVRLPADEARRLLAQAASGGSDGRIPFRAVTREGDSRVFEGSAHLLEENGVSVISDIDDTIKVSEVRDKKALLANTFLREFRAVPGMAGLYSAWAKRSASFHYVSASPWQLFEPLEEFVRASGFPRGTFHMKSFRIKDAGTIAQLLASPEGYKRSQIDPLFEQFPARSFILVGDSGEKDPEIYGAVARRFPSQTRLIVIRDVTGDGPGSERMREAFKGVPAEKWRIVREAADLEGLKAEIR